MGSSTTQEYSVTVSVMGMQLGLAGAAHEAAQLHQNVSLKHTTR